MKCKIPGGSLASVKLFFFRQICWDEARGVVPSANEFSCFDNRDPNANGFRTLSCRKLHCLHCVEQMRMAPSTMESALVCVCFPFRYLFGMGSGTRANESSSFDNSPLTANRFRVPSLHEEKTTSLLHCAGRHAAEDESTRDGLSPCICFRYSERLFAWQRVSYATIHQVR